MTDDGQKQCRKCLIFKDLSEFYRARTNLDGYMLRCKMCVKQQPSKQYDPEKKQKLNTEYYRDIKGRARAMFSKCRHRSRNKDKLTYMRIENALVKGYCERTFIQFQLGPHERYKHHPYAPSIDKIDPFGDYTDDNIQVVCYVYNAGKNQMTNDEYIDFCRKVIAAEDVRRKTNGGICN